jgi:acyl-CoA oxidase
VQGAKVSGWRKNLQQMLRPNAISLVDSWAFTDYELNSALGRKDGDVYSALLRMAKGSPLNKTDEGPAWETVLKPAMEKLQRSKL